MGKKMNAVSVFLGDLDDRKCRSLQDLAWSFNDSHPQKKRTENDLGPLGLSCSHLIRLPEIRDGPQNESLISQLNSQTEPPRRGSKNLKTFFSPAFLPLCGGMISQTVP